MAEDRFETRDGGFRPLGSWTLLFRGFQVAADWKKLALAAGGILTMAFSWWLLAVIFGGDTPKAWPSDYPVDRYTKSGDTEEVAKMRAWEAFKSDRAQWNLRHDAAGSSESRYYTDTGDLATNPTEYNTLLPFVEEAIKRAQLDGAPVRVVTYRVETTKDKDGKDVTRKVDEKPLSIDDRPAMVQLKPAGRLRVWPFWEVRGPNPYLMVTGQTGRVEADGTPRYAPWERGKFFDWFSTSQLPVLLEPVAKFARPVIYLLQPNAGFRNQAYFFLVILATLATWSLFGGAITRMAAVQIARKEKIGIGEAFRFAKGQWKSYLFAAVFPLVVVAFLVLCCVLFGVIGLIPILGDFVAGLLWILVILAGLGMAAVLVGYLVGWPMIQATISTEGSDSFDALSRTYSYVFQSPWNYLSYAAVALAYGAVVVFFVGFMGSLSVYLGKWGVSQTPFSGPAYTNREPSYLFVYAPTSFGWRELLLQGATVEGSRVVEHGVIQQAAYNKYLESFKWYNHLGAVLVSAWIYVVFLAVIGFGYSYFWSASTIIYLLMRNKVDDTDLDEVYLEEEEAEDIYTPPAPQETAPAKPGTTPLTMIEPPVPRPTPLVPAPAPTGATDGNGASPAASANP